MKRLFSNVELLYKLAKYGCGLDLTYDKESDTITVNETQDRIDEVVNKLKQKIRKK